MSASNVYDSIGKPWVCPQTFLKFRTNNLPRIDVLLREVKLDLIGNILVGSLAGYCADRTTKYASP